jgi:hypothetical protein
MRLLTLSLLALMIWGTGAAADRDRRDHRKDDRRDHRDNRRDTRDHRRDDRRDTRDHRRDTRHDRADHRRDVRDNRRDVRDNRRYHNHNNRRVNRYRNYNTRAVRSDRRRIDRVSVLRPRDGRFYFHGGRSVVYSRPIIRERYYNVRVRPQIIVENYPPQYGYIWVQGNWSWSGAEWVWNSGHYAPDPGIQAYYDDDSIDFDANYQVGVDVNVGYD